MLARDVTFHHQIQNATFEMPTFPRDEIGKIISLWLRNFVKKTSLFFAVSIDNQQFDKIRSGQDFLTPWYKLAQITRISIIACIR